MISLKLNFRPFKEISSYFQINKEIKIQLIFLDVYSVALDNVGNIESIPVTPDVSLVISSTNHSLVQKQAIRIIHAPGSNEVGIQCNGVTCKGWISVYTLTGNLIDRFRLDDNNLINWDITSLPTGMYIWEYQNFPYLQKGKVVKIR